MCKPLQVPPLPTDDSKEIRQRGVLWLGVGLECRGDQPALEDQGQAGPHLLDTAFPRRTHHSLLLHLNQARGPGGATWHQSRDPFSCGPDLGRAVPGGWAMRAGPARAGQGCSPRTALRGDSQEACSGSLIMSPAMAAAPFYGQMAQEV